MGSESFIGDLQKAFALLNKTLFKKKITTVPFIVQTKRKTSLRWVPELESIAIGVEIANLDINEVFGVLLHEMIHLANFQAGSVDVTTNQYHNKYFLNLALKVGFVVIKHKTQGWSITGIMLPRNVVERCYLREPDKENYKLLKEVSSKIEFNLASYKEAQKEIYQKLKLEKPTKTYFLKYQCNCQPPHNSIRSGRRPDGPNALNIQCMSCRSQFECVTEIDEKGD